MEECSLTVYKQHPFLAASSDGHISDPTAKSPNGVLEIKCAFSVAGTSVMHMSPTEIAESFPSFYLESSANGIHLKQSSKHYSQIQGEMVIKESQSCDFVVWTAAKNDNLFIERVPFDSNFGKTKCL